MWRYGMKKVAVIVGGVVVVSVLGGALFLHTNSRGKSEASIYMAGSRELNVADAEGKLPLVKAVLAKDTPAVLYMLTQGVDVDKQDKDGNSAVMVAIEGGDSQLLAQLLASSHADLTQPIYLEKAINSGNVDSVRELLQKGADANAILSFKGRRRPDDVLTYEDQRVMTPLKKAVMEHKAEVADVLLANGAEGAEYFLTTELLNLPIDMVKVLAKKVGDLRRVFYKNMDLLTYVAGEGEPQLVEFMLQENAGDVNKALIRVLTHRKVDNNYEATVDLFLKAGANPTPELLELMLKKKRGHVFNQLSACYADPNVTFSDTNETLLMYAIRTGNEDVVTMLLNKGVDIWADKKDGISPLSVVIKLRKEYPQFIKLFEDRIKGVDETGYSGETLLMLYAKVGDWEDFQRILNKGGDIWQKDNEGKTLLMYTSEGGNTKILTYLLGKGDNVNARDKNGRTPLMYAAAVGQTKFVKSLIDYGADFSASDNEGKNVLMYAAENGHEDIVNMLINSGESAASEDKFSRSVLMYAVKGSNLGAVETLLLKGVDVNHIDADSVPVMSYAVKAQNPKIVKLLKDKGANIYAMDKDGYFPAIWALRNGNQEIFELTFPSRMEVAEKSNDGKSLMVHAVDGGNIELMRWILEKKRYLLSVRDQDGRSALMLLSRAGRPEMVRMVSSTSYANMEEKDNDGRDALMYAAQSEAGVNLITLLQKRGNKSEVNVADNHGRTVLMYAVGYKNNQPVKIHMLLTRGADAMAKDKDGKSVLMYAVGNAENSVSANAVKELLTRIKDVNTQDKDGKTALMYAAGNPNADANVVIELLNVGADINALDSQGKSVLMYAVESGDISKVRILLSAGAKSDVLTKDGKSLKDFINPQLLCFRSAVETLLK